MIVTDVLLKNVLTKMKIDFHTHYNKKGFKDLCKKAIKLGLDALVVEGLPDNQDRKYKNLSIFPAQEVGWVAALERSEYLSIEHYRRDIKSIPTKSDVYRGRALVLLPEEKPFLHDYDQRLFNLLENVSNLGGIVISLQDDANCPITHTIRESKLVYPFDAKRIRPCSFHDIHHEFPWAPSAVAGSDSYDARDLKTGKAFTEYPQEIKTKEQLISAIKNRLPNKLFVHGNDKSSKIRIEDTVKPLRLDMQNFTIQIKREN